MIRIRDLTLSRGGRELLNGAEVNLMPGERVALVGPNGCGKTSLLAALSGDALIDAGRIEQPYKRVTRLAQSAPNSELPAWRYLLEGDTELAAANHELELARVPAPLETSAATAAAAQQASHGAARADSLEASDAEGLRLAAAHERWLEAGGVEAPARSRALLAGLGFSARDSEAPVSNLSGGWRMRLNLARALFAPGDLLLLDEPTNHLDLDAVLWLERWLVRCECTMVIVSHDRDFLDRVVRACLHIEDGKLHRYAGGYSDFERARALREHQQQREQQSLTVQRAHLETFINRFRAQANRARQVQSRLKTLERMAEVAPIRSLRGIDIVLPEVGDSPETLLRAQTLSAGYAETPIVRINRLSINRGARIGILGRNGAGKSTLIKTLVGELAALSGEVHLARGLRIGYFAQQAVESLRSDESALQHLQRAAPAEREQNLRDFLGRFGFRGDDAMRAMGPMSGGEKARLVLALVVWGKPQILVLDEPTNHLDAQTRDALADALAQYDGALLLVSHDRYLLRASVDRLVIVDQGQLLDYDGDLEEYHEWIAARAPGRAVHEQATETGEHSATGKAAPTGSSVAAPSDRREARRLAAERRVAIAERTRPIDAKIRVVEDRLQALGSELSAIEGSLQDPELYSAGSDPKRAGALNRRRSELRREQEAAETQWLSLQEARERALADLEFERTR